MEVFKRSADKIPFNFEGSGFEYFKIWIVNILLTIVTFGIYSAWAKVRRKQYIYGNTSLDGVYFEYLAKPTKILKGRILAVLFLMAYQVGVRFFPPLGMAFILLLAFLFPWVINKGLKFNAVNSSYKNIRFNFNATYSKTFVNITLVSLLIPLTFGLAYPYVIYRMKKHVVEHSCFGTTPFKFNGDANGFYRIYVMVFAFFLAPLVAAAIAKDVFANPSTGAVVPFLILALYFLIFVYIRTYQTNYILSNTAINTHRFNSSLFLPPMIFIYATNIIATALSFGLFIPWAKTRLLKYRLENLEVIPGIGLEEFLNIKQEEMSAFGDEISDLFDIDIGL
ncbi:MAG: DUF898 domain-containing protein [Desulfobacterales bacterium]|nr:DUF898 domain-containing protein [Desulfobacterales bacterium]